MTAFVPMTSTRGFAGTVEGLETLGYDVIGGAGAGSMRASGYLPLYLRIVDYVVSGTIWGLAISTVIVFAMVGILLRSLQLTAAAVPTNLFPVALVFGMMGWTGIPLDIATATIGAIVLGIAVDDTIHFLFRYRSEREAGLSREEAVGRTYRETGRAVVFASMVLAIGFAVLATSSSQVHRVLRHRGVALHRGRHAGGPVASPRRSSCWAAGKAIRSMETIRGRRPPHPPPWSPRNDEHGDA